MRQKLRLFDDEPRHALQIIERRGGARLCERRARHGITRFRPIAEREQCLLAVDGSPGARDVQHLLCAEVGFREPPRRFGERAVVTNVAAKLRERNEYLARIGNGLAKAGERERFRERHQIAERRGLQMGQCIGRIEPPAGGKGRQYVVQG